MYLYHIKLHFYNDCKLFVKVKKKSSITQWMIFCLKLDKIPKVF